MLGVFKCVCMYTLAVVVFFVCVQHEGASDVLEA